MHIHEIDLKTLTYCVKITKIAFPVSLFTRIGLDKPFMSEYNFNVKIIGRSSGVMRVFYDLIIKGLKKNSLFYFYTSLYREARFLGPRMRAAGFTYFYEGRKDE